MNFANKQRRHCPLLSPQRDPHGKRRQTEERTAMQSEVCWTKHGFQLATEYRIKHAAKRPSHTSQLREEIANQ